MSIRSRLLILVVVVVAIGVILIATRRAGFSGGLRAAFDAEFLTRPDGYPGLSKHYGFRFPTEPVQMDPGLMYKAVADGQIDVIDGFATDGRIPAYDLLVLDDDKSFFPPYYAAPLVRTDTLAMHPQLRNELNRLGGRISDEAMRRLNYQVDEKGRRASDVAREFLLKGGLIPEHAHAGNGAAGSVVVGGKQFTEQEILGEMIAILIESDTDLRVRRKLNLGGTMICFNALRSGDIDVYPEYTGTGLVNILKANVVNDPEEVYSIVKTQFRDQWGLIWLEPFGFNNTYTLTMRRDQAERVGIRTISDLAAVVNRERRHR